MINLSVRVRIIMFVAVCAVAVTAYWLIAGPTPQPLSYHKFGDARTLVSVPNALNVLSNFPFILVGALGIAFMLTGKSRRPGVFLESYERWPYWLYFIGLVLTGIASSYYHANPTNDTLVWDRAALAITFMALFTGILAERLHPECARWLLVPLVVLGACSVFYWDWTEQHGMGDLRLYFTVQFLPLIVVPILLILYPARYTGSGNLLASLLCYGLAKGLEEMDKQIYTGSSSIVSGHTLKHLVAGLSAGFILLMLMQRQPRAAMSPAGVETKPAFAE